MSPEDKRRLLVIFAAVFSLFLLLFILSCIPVYLYILFISVGSCIVYFRKEEELQLFERLGLNPRRGLSVPTALLRWLPGRTLRGVPPPGRNKIRKSDARNSIASHSDRHFVGSYYNRDRALGDSVFSPRDILMGSYLAKAEESPSAAVRAAGGSRTFINPREQLRERLARPNHAIHTPNRRLSFGEPVGTSRFTITPHRHYPLQQTGASPIGVMPPAKWDGLCKKNVLTQRNSSTVHSPVTVKIARPDPTRSSFFDHLNSPGAVTSPGFGAQTDPCSREAVLSVLRESRKREVDEEDKTSGQKSKRRRHDSGESSQSAFEPLLANGAPSHLMPKHGNLKRGMNSSLVEESTMKRSRTSSISSVVGAPVPSGVPGSVRNPIRSSLSSSQGFPQRRAASSLSLSPFASPGGSRCQTPERASKKAREDEPFSPSFTSFLKTDMVTSDPSPSAVKVTPKSETPVAASDSGGSGGKRRRRIQLVTTNRGDQILLPPPPELGYTITVKDLDMEKKAALTQIQKVLEEPEPEVPAPVPQPSPVPSLTLFSKPASTSSSETAPPARSAPSLLSLSTPVQETTPATTTTTPAPTIDLTITAPSAVSTSPPTLTSGPTSTSTLAPLTSSISNPLLESLKNMKKNPLLNATSVLGTTTSAPAISFASLSTPAATLNSSIGAVKSESGSVLVQSSLLTPASISAPVSKPATSMPSAFAQILAKPLQPPSSMPSLGGGGSLFSLVKPVATPASQPPASTAVPPTAAVNPTLSTSSISNPLSTGFKPIFGPATTTPASIAEVKPTQPTFKPLFGSSTTESGISSFGQTVASTTSTPAAPSTQNSSLLFGGLTSTQPLTVSTSSTPTLPTQAPSQSLFGSWNATTTSAPPTNTTFQFGATTTTTATPAPSTTTASTGSTTLAFQFGAANTAPAPQTQSTFAFGQQPTSQNSTSTPFGTFSLTGNATTTSAAPTTQATFGSSTFTAPASSFPGATQQVPGAPKPFTFGASGGNSGTAPFTFGAAAASTAASSFGTNSQATFGGASSGFPFGNTTTPSAAPIFGASTQTAAPLPTQATTFSFGGASTATQNPAPSTPAPPASGGFNFGASATPFGTPAPAAQTPGFSFGANNTENKPAFGTSTPAFGQGPAGMSMPFGSPGTPATPGFGAIGGLNPTMSPFGASPATFSIGTGSKPSGQRRLQARRQHPRKK